MSSPPPLVLTDKAIAMAKQKISEAKQDDPQQDIRGLRLGVKGSGCSGYSYVIEFAADPRKDRDTVFIFDGLEVVIDTRSLKYLEGCTLDWHSSLMGYGFRWHNPNASSTCGCGESFSVK